jgi:hypothetical protein
MPFAISDIYDVIPYDGLLPTEQALAANYSPGKTLTLHHTCTLFDISNFVVDYLLSDILVSCPFRSLLDRGDDNLIRAYYLTVSLSLPVGSYHFVIHRPSSTLIPTLDQSERGIFDRHCLKLAKLCSQVGCLVTGLCFPAIQGHI